MNKLSFFAVVMAAVAFTSCGGKKALPPVQDAETIKIFDQQQLPSGVKAALDSLATAYCNQGLMPILLEGKSGVQLTKTEKQLKPDYLLPPTAADKAATVADKYRMASALSVDTRIADIYDMPAESYKTTIARLTGETDDLSFKVLENAAAVYSTSQELYDTMKAYGRSNFFWQLATASLVEELYVMAQNTEKYITVFDDQKAAGVAQRTALVAEATTFLNEYDDEATPLVQAIEPLKAISATTAEQLKVQLEEAKAVIAEVRNTLLKL